MVLRLREDYKKVLWNNFTSDAEAVADAVLTRLDETFTEDDLQSAINDELIYTADQWTILQEYTTISELDSNSYFNALDSFYCSLLDCCEETEEEE